MFKNNIFGQVFATKNACVGEILVKIGFFVAFQESSKSPFFLSIKTSQCFLKKCASLVYDTSRQVAGFTLKNVYVFRFK